MFTLYTSRNLTKLSNQASENLRQSLRGSFAEQTIIVPSRGIEHWLTLELARHHKIAMRLNFQLPSAFIWGLTRKLLGDLPPQSAFSGYELNFRLYAWLKDEQNLRKVPALQHYLQQADERKRWQLAAKIADVFDQYLLYRDDMLKAWEAGELIYNLDPNEQWQAFLWRELTKNGHPHRARLFSEVLAKLQKKNINADLTKQITVFAPSSMPPQQLAILHALSNHINVDLYALSPCAKYWSDIRFKNEYHTQTPNMAEDWYWQIGHPLLASLGKCGRDFFDYLTEITSNHNAHHVDLDEGNSSPANNLLHALQHDIINLQLRTPSQKLPLAPNDNSLTLHVAHSPLREIEILHDELLARFASDPTLQPSDVAVLTPNIDKYAPFIKAVFTNSENSIPYSLADVGYKSYQPLLDVCCNLLLLPQSRFIAEEILELLQHEEIATKAQINNEELSLLRTWLNEAGARWGLDEEHLQSFNLAPHNNYTLRTSLDRLLLGFALNPELAKDEPPLFNEIMPLNLLEGSNVQIVAKFAHFVDKLAHWRQILASPVSGKDWALRLISLFDDFVADDVPDNYALKTWHKACMQLDHSSSDLDLPYDLVHLLLQNELEQSSAKINLVQGKVTFGTMVPLRSLPFRLICLLGLDDGAMPRRSNAPSFDLITLHPRLNDRARRFDDRYLLLETLICAQDSLYLSYVGKDVKTCASLPPSVLVYEILAAANATAFCGDGQKVSTKITIEHCLQPFALENFAHNNRLSFSKMWHEAACELQNLPNLKTQNTPNTEPIFWINSLSVALLTKITPQTLLKGLSNPAKFLLEHSLKISVPRLALSLSEDEPFAFEYQHNFKLQELQFKAASLNWSKQMQAKLAHACHYLPLGQIGQSLWRKKYTDIALFCEQFIENISPKLTNISINLELDNMQIMGDLSVTRYLPKSHENTLQIIDYRLYQAGGHDFTNFWLKHLLLNTVEPTISYLATPHETLRADVITNPNHYLQDWLQVFADAHRAPSLLLPKVSYVFAKDLQNSKIKDPLTNAHKNWDNFYAKNAWYQLAYRGFNPIVQEEFSNLAQKLYNPALSLVTGQKNFKR